MENKQPDKRTQVNDEARTERYRLHEPKTHKRDRSCNSMNLVACKLHEGRTRITNTEIQHRDRRAMTYGHGSSTGRDGNKHYSLKQTKCIHQENKHNGDRGESVESIMAMGFICVRLNNKYETHAYCMKQNNPAKHTKDKDGIRAERYRLHQPETDKGVRSSRIYCFWFKA
eukprot:4414784-Heterocapsa_arctica.AAC.1